MKLIIDIPEEVYKSIQDNDYCGILNSDMYNAIANGTPLPKGHGRLIDADVLADGFEDNYEFCEEVNATPTIIEAKED